MGTVPISLNNLRLANRKWGLTPLQLLAEIHHALGLAKSERAMCALTGSLSISASDASSLQPRARAQSPIAANNRRAMPWRRQAGATYTPSTKPTGDDSVPFT